VVTPLHNFAMPLIRYELGDLAIPGRPCRCGRAHPVLAQVLGRARNMLLLPDGTRRWPVLGIRAMRAAAPIRQAQFVQVTRTRLEVLLVCERPLSPAEEATVVNLVRGRQPVAMDVVLTPVREIARSEGGKFEEFICRAE
jgi:phenylacetate-CoA ligase